MKKVIAGLVLVLMLSSCANASDWKRYVRVDWGVVRDKWNDASDYVKGIFGTKHVYSDDVLPESIAKDWDRLTDTLTDTLTLQDKHNSLPRRSWMPFRENQRSNAKRINALLDRALGILAKGDAGETRMEATELRDAITRKRTELDDLRNRRINAPEKSRLPWKLTKNKADEKIAALEEELEDCREELNAITARLTEDLRGVGLVLDASQVDVLLNSVTGDDLLMNASVFANVKAVVLKLEELAQKETNTLDITRRYTGMYLVLNDLLLHTQDELIRKIDDDYKPKLNSITSEAESLRKEALAKSNQEDYTLDQRRAFARNAESNAMTIQVARLYLELLNSQKTGAQERVRVLRLNRDLADNTYRTVKSSGELKGLIHSGLSTFDAVGALSMPELKVFENGGLKMRLEFEEINRRLKK